MSPRRTDFHNEEMAENEDVEELKARQKAWVQGICDRLRISYTELARMAGLNPATLTRPMNDRTYKHAMSAKTINAIAKATNTPEPSETVTSEHLQHKDPLLTVRVIGTAAAGHWKDLSLIADDYSIDDEISFPEERRYAGRKQYALLVEGDSINRMIPNGEWAICVAWDELGRDPKDGELVHVERSRGGLHEATLKVVRFGSGGRIELWPNSTNPKFQEPISLEHSDDGTEVTIRGKVIAAHRSIG